MSKDTPGQPQFELGRRVRTNEELTDATRDLLAGLSADYIRRSNISVRKANMEGIITEVELVPCPDGRLRVFFVQEVGASSNVGAYLRSEITPVSEG